MNPLTKRRLLVVMANSPLPMQRGSAIVACNSLRELRGRFSVDLVCPLPQGEGVDELNALVDVATYVPCASPSKFARWRNHLRRLAMWEPPLSGDADFRSMQEAVRGRIRAARYDAFLLFEITALECCPPDVLRRAAVQMEDPQSIKYERISRLPIFSIFQRLKWKLLAQLMRRYEARVLPGVGRVLLLSANDVDDMRSETGLSNMAHVPYGIDAREGSKISGYSEREHAIVYSGNMFHSPNVDGALFLLDEIFPKVLRHRPEAQLWIVGANPDVRLVKAAQKYGRSVVVTGRVEDVSVYIRRAMVSVCPVRLRIGVQTKMLEALSWGTPVVTTSAGNAGIAGISGKHLWEVDDPGVFAQKICELLAGGGWQEMADAGRSLVRDHFTWSHSALLLEEQLSALIARN